MSKSIIITMLCIILISMIFVFPMRLNATTIDPDDYRPTELTDEEAAPITEKFGIVVSVIRTVGIVVTVVVLLVIGIKYMVGSVSERADYKKSLAPYLIGAVMIFALTQVLAIIIDFAGNIE